MWILHRLTQVSRVTRSTINNTLKLQTLTFLLASTKDAYLIVCLLISKSTNDCTRFLLLFLLHGTSLILPLIYKLFLVPKLALTKHIRGLVSLGSDELQIELSRSTTQYTDNHLAKP